MLRDITQVVQQGSVDMETTMEKQRENKIRQWVSMWLDKQNTGIEDLFAPTPSTSRAGGRSITEVGKSSCGLTSGTPGEPCSAGISGSIFTKGTKP